MSLVSVSEVAVILETVTRYVAGRGIDGTKAPEGGGYTLLTQRLIGEYVPQQGDGGRHRARDSDLDYVLQSGLEGLVCARPPCVPSGKPCTGRR